MTQIYWQGKYVEKDLNGIYGIYRFDKLIYIGSTSRNFKERLKEHNQNIEKGSPLLYRYIRKHSNSKYTMRPIVIKEYVRTNRNIELENLHWMELSLISCFRPICNVSGLITNFNF